MLHKTIKDQIKEAMRAKDSLRLDTLRGLNALFLNEMITGKLVTDFLPDEKALPLVKRSVKQRKDSIEQFEKGGRKDLADKERAELKILEEFLPAGMSRQEIQKVVTARLTALKASGSFDPDSKAALPAQAGKITGMIMKELAGKADGSDVRAVVDDMIKSA